MKDEQDFQREIEKHTEQEELARKILGVNQYASKAAVRDAFRALAKKYHPDKNSNSEKAERQFMLALQSYELLTGKRDHLDFKDEGPVEEEHRIGNYMSNDWGYYCYWKETFMDDFLANAPDEDKNTENRKPSSRKRRR